MKKTIFSVLIVCIFCWHGAAQTPCSQIQLGNGMIAGMPIDIGMKIADDFIVASGTSNFSMESITANLLSDDNIGSVDILFYQDNAGMPGAQIGTTIEGVIPSLQTFIGTYGTSVLREVKIDLPVPVDFAGAQNTSTTYWVQLISVPASGSVVWESTAVDIIGNPLAFYPTGAPSWFASSDSDCVFTVEGICTTECTEPSALTVEVNGASADIMWVAGGTETEWEIEYGPSGFTPGSGTIVIDNDGILGETITDLISEMEYEIYVTAVCAPENNSSMVGPITFTTQSLGLTHQVFQGFSYYPNPVTSELSLKATSQIQQVVIYDMFGQEIFKSLPNNLSSDLELNGIQGGVYLMKVTIDNSVGVYRIIKQ